MNAECRVVAATAFIAIWATGCDSRVLVPGQGEPGIDAAVSGPDGGATDVPVPEGYLWPGTTYEIVFLTSGDWVEGDTSAGSGCPIVGEGTYTLRGNELSWRFCRRAPDGLYDYALGMKTLPEVRLGDVQLAIRALVLSPPKTNCGIDKAFLKLVVASSAGMFEYLDGFYVCWQEGIYVDGLNAVYTEMHSAALMD